MKALFHLICLLLIVGIAASLPPSTQAQSPTAFTCQVDGKPMQTQGKIAGIASNTSVLPDATRVQQFASLITQAGIKKTIRTLRWDQLEPIKGTYLWDDPGSNGEGLHDSATAALPPDTIIFKPALTPKWASTNPNATNFNSYPPANLNDWRQFVTAAVKRYGHGPGGNGTVRDWEPWNEPDGGEYFTGTSQQYLEINNLAYDAIKSADPSAVFWAPGMVVWPDTMVATANGLRVPEKGEAKYNQYKKRWELFYLLLDEGKFDGFSFHVYGSDVHVYKLTQAIKQKLAQYPQHASKKLLLSETNLPVGIPWENCPYDTMSEEAQKQILEQRYACSFNAGVDIALWFPIRDRTNSNCQNGNLKDGIIRRDYTPKPAFEGLKNINQALAAANPLPTIVPPTPSPTPQAPSPTLTQAPSPTSISWDLNGNGKVDIFDWSYFVKGFGSNFSLVDIPNFISALGK